MKSSLVLVVVIISALETIILSQQSSSTLIGQTQPRIVGGYTIPIEEAPWTVQILYHKQKHCGGSIVSVSKILSAAHCTHGLVRFLFSIRAGSFKFDTGGQTRKISKIIEHPQYSKTTLANDICMLFLTKRLKLSSSVAVISIDKKNLSPPDGIEVLAIGWGQTCEDFICDSSKTLQAVKIPIVGNDRCRKIYKKYENDIKILKSMFCAGLKIGGKDTCQGDSGGPCTFNNTLVGIVSFGVGCARPNLPGVYTSVAAYKEWINKYL